MRDSAVSIYPLYYPGFWATVTIDHLKKKVTLAVSKTFGPSIALQKLVIEAAGKPTSEAKAFAFPAFTLAAGRQLDLSKWYTEITSSSPKEAVLPQADKVKFQYVNE